MNGRRPGGQEAPRQRPQQRPVDQQRPSERAGGVPPRRPAQRPGAPTATRRPAPQGRDRYRSGNQADAFNERYEEMVSPRSADEVNRGTYADMSAFESKGHRKIDPAIMRAKRRKELVKKYLPVAVAGAVLIAVLWIYLGVIRPAGIYDDAVAAMDEGDRYTAEELFLKVKGHKDSDSYLTYIDGLEALGASEFNLAASIFESLGDFRDSGDRAAEAMSRLDSPAPLNTGVTAPALPTPTVPTPTVPKPTQPVGKTEAELYAEAIGLTDMGNARGANVIFGSIINYKESKTYADYTYAMMCAEDGRYTEAANIFTALGDFRDCADRAKDAEYSHALSIYQSGDVSRLSEVIGLFEALGSYRDSASQLEAARSQYLTEGIYALTNGEYDRAIEIFTALGDYPGASGYLAEAQAGKAEAAEPPSMTPTLPDTPAA